MTTNEKVISDMELDMVVGGASVMFLKKREDGKVDSFLVSADKDIEKLKQLISNGEMDKIKSDNSSVFVGEGIPTDKVNAYVGIQKKRYPDLELNWLN